MRSGWHTIVSYLALIVVSFNSCDKAKPVEEPSSNRDNLPNVIFINVDDWGWADNETVNPQWFKTPNINSLRKESLVFENAYAAAANCAPSRACLLSGMNTPRHGVYTVSPSARGKAQTRRIVPIKNTNHLRDSVILIPELFKQKGYVTANFGKWHVSPDPATQGIEYNVGGSDRGNPGKDGYFSPHKISNITDGPEGEYLTDRLTNEAIDFIENNQDTNFFIYLPYYAVHSPFLPKPALYEKDYKDKEVYLHDSQRKYAAMVEGLDQNIGRLLAAIDRSNLASSTMIVLTSDNGGIAAVSPQTPARAGKGSYFQGGLKVPLMIRWKGVSEPRVVNIPTGNLDFFPTFREMLDVEVDQPMDGQSLLNIIKGGDGEALKDRALYWHFPIYVQAYQGEQDEARDPLFRTRPGSLIQKNGWVLHHYFEENEVLLYDLGEGEVQELSAEFPQKKKELYEELQRWRTSINASIPTKINKHFDPTFDSK